MGGSQKIKMRFGGDMNANSLWITELCMGTLLRFHRLVNAAGAPCSHQLGVGERERERESPTVRIQTIFDRGNTTRRRSSVKSLFTIAMQCSKCVII